MLYPFVRLSALLSSDSERADRYVRAAGKVLVNLGDFLSGGSVTEWLKEDEPDKYRQAERLGLEVAELEKLTNTLQADINDLSNQLNSVSDPDAYLASTVRDSLNSMGFTVSKGTINSLRSKALESEKKSDAKRAALESKIASKERDLTEARNRLADKQNELETERNKSIATKVFE